MKRLPWAVLLGSTALLFGAACNAVVEVGPDAGPDDDKPDTGRVDAGSRDTGTDTGAADARPDARDSGRSDDAGDSGTTDDAGDSGTSDDAGDGGTSDDAGDGGVVDPCSGLDLTTDGENCGVCGHSCLGGACANSTCQAFVLATLTNKPFRIAIDSNNAYWTVNDTAGSIGVVQLDGGVVTPQGGTPGVLASGVTAPRDLKTDGVNVYFHSSNTGTTARGIWKVSTSGGTATRIVDYGDSGNSIAINQDSIFWTYGSKAKVGMVHFDGTGLKDLVSTMTGTAPKGIAADDVNVFFTSSATTKVVQRAPVDGSLNGASEVISQSGDANVALTADTSHVFWLDGSGNVYQIDKNSQAPTTRKTLATIAGANTIGTDGTNVYVAAKPSGAITVGQLWAVPVNGSDADKRVIIDNLSNDPEGIAVDAKAVYLADTAGMKIYKVAK